MTLRDKDMPRASEKARQQRKGLVGRWRQLYRSSSSDLRNYAGVYGHRSSVSLSGSLEYPELESLRGPGMLLGPNARHLLSTLSVEDSQEVLKEAKNRISCPEMSQLSRRTLPRSPAVDWAKYYGDCVGSLSALRSEARLEVIISSGEDDRLDVRSMELRASTLDFEKDLAKQQERAREDLMMKLQSFDEPSNKHSDDDEESKRLSAASTATDDTIKASSILTRDIRVPGSFD
jgi:hypothetical protein